MNKPSKHNFSVDYYEWSEVKDYLDAKLGKDIRDFSGKFGKDSRGVVPYQDFWHFILHHYEVERDGFLQLTPSWDLLKLPKEDWWCRPILKALQDFGEEPLTVRTSW